jgi:hypothetical protein
VTAAIVVAGLVAYIAFVLLVGKAIDTDSREDG